MKYEWLCLFCFVVVLCMTCLLEDLEIKIKIVNYFVKLCCFTFKCMHLGDTKVACRRVLRLIFCAYVIIFIYWSYIIGL